MTTNFSKIAEFPASRATLLQTIREPKMNNTKIDHGDNVTFLVSSTSTSGIQVSVMRAFQIEDDAWVYFESLSHYSRRLWATYPDHEPKLLSTKSYMQFRGLEYK